MQMKTIAAAVVWNFDVEVVDGQTVEPKLSCLLQMKNGVMVKISYYTRMLSAEHPAYTEKSSDTDRATIPRTPNYLYLSIYRT
ncbi:hypothetical protein OsJ_26653 [Oryza sativa Japonica Group]|uniref:Uncharacterized protein n=1 Tax=Oryza sativa subsp. japonica TaxID=39947 RepID=B9FZY3_ORYSJ|nr:hypothetical protein OsJ_26653 [Oryza sativa Japonica Group]